MCCTQCQMVVALTRTPPTWNSSIAAVSKGTKIANKHACRFTWWSIRWLGSIPNSSSNGTIWPISQRCGQRPTRRFQRMIPNTVFSWRGFMPLLSSFFPQTGQFGQGLDCWARCVNTASTNRIVKQHAKPHAAPASALKVIACSMALMWSCQIGSVSSMLIGSMTSNLSFSFRCLINSKV